MSDSGRHRSPVSPGDVVGGKYRVERVLGAGGMGVVVEATHLDLAQPVALKFIQATALASSASLERFMREARAAVRLRSEHVCRVLDVGRDGDRPYMVLELLEGMDLAKVAKHHGPLPVADAVEYVLQACDALVEAHALGIVHRDLKPQNVFVTKRVNGTPLVKVLDFGIAKTVGAAAAGQMALTDSSAIIGSPLYMAPEQMRAPKTVDVRIDIWALGVILYELLGGQLPFDGETVTEVCIKVVNEEPTRLLDLRPGLDRKLVDVVMRCLEKDPEDRWQNVAQLAVELEPFSRSGKQGAFSRPWRSFSETQDSSGHPRVVVASSHPDDTGPSTAITMPSVPGAAIHAALLPNAATTPMPGGLGVVSSVRAGPAPVVIADDPRPLVSTDTAWGEGTARQPAQSVSPARARVLVPIAIAAFLTAAAAGFVFRPTPRAPANVQASAPPTALSTLPTPEPSPVTLVKDPTPRDPMVAPTEKRIAPPAVAPAAVRGGPLVRPGVRPPEPVAPRSDVPPPATKPAEPPAETPRAADPKPAETTVRNGAPIIR